MEAEILVVTTFWDARCYGTSEASGSVFSTVSRILEKCQNASKHKGKVIWKNILFGCPQELKTE